MLEHTCSGPSYLGEILYGVRIGRRRKVVRREPARAAAPRAPSEFAAEISDGRSRTAPGRRTSGLAAAAATFCVVVPGGQPRRRGGRRRVATHLGGRRCGRDRALTAFEAMKAGARHAGRLEKRRLEFVARAASARRSLQDARRAWRGH